MGKRELLLAAVFVVLGIGVYQLTAPPGDGSRSGFSLSRIFDEIRRDIRGRPESAEETRRISVPAPATVTELRIVLRSAPVTITGEDRDDIDVEYFVRSNGRDKAEAEKLVKESTLLIDQAGALVILTGRFPEDGTQNARLTLKVPRRLAIRMDEKVAPMKIDGVASVTVGTGTNETTITNVTGPVVLTQRGRAVRIENVGALRLNASGGADVTIAGVNGDAMLTLQSAKVGAKGLGGGLEVESRNSELRLEELTRLNGTVRLNLTEGELTLIGLATEARIDGRRTEMRVELSRAVPLAIYNDGEPVEVQLPPGGVRVDAVASGARVSLDPALQKAGLAVEATGDRTAGPVDERVAGAIAGGGAMITIRNRSADIVLQSAAPPAGKASPAPPSTKGD